MSAAFADHFSAVAGDYASYRPRYPDALFDHLAALAPARELAWDCAAGSGQATVGLAARFAHVVATDASAAQLAEAPPLANVSYEVAAAEASPLADAAADLVTVAQALHWLDLPRFYAEVARVLRPGGVLAVWTYALQRVEDPAIDHAVRRFHDEVVGPWWPPERALVESGYRTLPFPWPELPAPALRLEADWTLGQFLGYLRTWSATSRYLAATREDPVAALAETLRPLWGDPATPRRVTWPLHLRAGRAPDATPDTAPSGGAAGR